MNDIDPDQIADEISFNPEEQAIRKQNHSLLLHAIETFTPKQKIVFREMVMNGRTAEDLAKQYNTEPHIIETVCLNARKKFKAFEEKHARGEIVIKTRKPIPKPKPKPRRRRRYTFLERLPIPPDEFDDDIDYILDSLSGDNFFEMNLDDIDYIE